MSFDSDYGEGYEFCSRRNSLPGLLPFDPSSIENLILSISDKFDFRVLMSNEKIRGAVLVTAGLAVAGGLLGNAYGGKMGAALGGAVGGACGIGLVVQPLKVAFTFIRADTFLRRPEYISKISTISMRDAWQDIRSQLSDIFDLVYDYLAGLGIKDYMAAAAFIANQSPQTKNLAMMILNTSAQILGKQLVSNLGAITSA